MTPRLLPAFASQPWVMGVVNVTPDSFSDGGRWLDTDLAIAHGRRLAADGAAIIDIGGESTRPGAHRVDAATERDRVIPVIAALAADGIVCSVDTSRAEVAAAAVEAGVGIINDVSGGMADPDMVDVVADSGLPWVVMHWRGPSDVMNSLAHYGDAAIDVRDELLARVDVALAAGVDERSLILDPGLGFAKNADHNWAVLRRLDLLVELGFPVLIGASRKRFLGELLSAPDGTPRPPDGRETATAAISMLAAQAGVWGVRVHDVTPTRDVLLALARAHADATESDAEAPTSPLREPSSGTARFPRLPMAPRPVPNVDDRITLSGLTVRGHHGVFEHEKRDGQDFVIDVTVWRDHAPAARDDDLAQTLNYAELAELARAVVAGPARDLIETVAAEIADTAVARWPMRRIEVTVHKPHAPIPLDFADVAVTVVRCPAPSNPPRVGEAGIYAGLTHTARDDGGTA
jgi:dihydropteroate synthase/dihydroneopterin aldolase